MGGRALRTLTGPHLTHHRPHRLTRRCQFDAVVLTHLHIHTVKPTNDNPDLPTNPGRHSARA
jgi:hypothetical protein